MSNLASPTITKIICPNCGRRGEFEEPTPDQTTGEIDLVTFVPPESFRKVQVGWNSDHVQLCCVYCGVPGIPFTGTH
jgi:hypothetical protein